MKLPVFAPLLLFAAPASVAAHGYVTNYILDGLSYITYLPVSSPNFTAPAPGIARAIFGIGPIKTPLQRNITCSETAVPLPGRTAPVSAGSNITFHWSEMPHNGPIMTYLSRCPDTGCGDYWGDDRDGGKAWFKIDENGYDGNGTWATKTLFRQGNTWYSKIPACLKAGEYLIRHEIISVSDGYKLGGCQFYPSCAQVTVVGNGTAVPTADEMVAFPGAYQPTDPGILFNTNLPYTEYPIPGPKVWTCPAE